MFVSLLAAVVATSLPQLVSAGDGATCAPDRGAQITKTVYADYPTIAELQGRSGTTTVRVDLAENGAVAGASVAESSGNALLDRAAVRAVKAMRFAPETRSCQSADW